MKKTTEILANLIINEVSPKVNKNKMNKETINRLFPPVLLAGIAEALSSGKITMHRARQWFDDRMYMDEQHEKLRKLGIKIGDSLLFDKIEIDVMNNR
jgi:hypothetical protein